MIVDMIRADVLKAPQRHIVFAVNMEGFNDVGFAGQVSSRFWQELASTGPKKLGEVMTHEAGDHTFHAVVCHSLGKGGWQQTPELDQCAQRDGCGQGVHRCCADGRGDGWSDERCRCLRQPWRVGTIQ